MTTFSVIVPVYNVEGYVRQCLRSLTDQSGAETEIIVVEDHSTDRSLEIVAEIVDREPRAKLVRSPSNVGLGAARNIGLRHATGDYVLFVDSDDFLVPGGFGRIRRRCSETGADLVIFDHQRLYWNNRSSRNQLREVFESNPGILTVDDDPRLLELLNVAWNKAYRREFIEESGLEFPPGYYEDIPWTYPLLCMADSIAMVNAVCISYRQRRGGSILKSSDDRHFQLIDQIERLLEMAQTRTELVRWRDQLWLRSAMHALKVLAEGERRLPKDRRRDFFDAAAEVLGPLTPPDEVLPGGATGLKVQLLAQGSYFRFQALKRVNEQVVRHRPRIQHATSRAKGAAERARETIERAPDRRSGDRDIVLFASLWNRPPSGNPLAIYRGLETSAPALDPIWSIPRDRHGSGGPSTIVEPNSAAYWRMLRASRFLVNDVNFPTEFEKRPGQTYLQTQHGTPLKFMGLDLQTRPLGAEGMSFSRLMHRVDQWDFNLSSNRYSTEVWRRAFPAEHEILELGYPRNDVLVRPPAGLAERVRKHLGIQDGSHVVLYCPTHREGSSSLALGLDVVKFLRSIGPDFTLLVRGHYFYDDDKGFDPADSHRLIDVSDHPSVEELYLAADVLLTDYSSAMFDFANLGRPIVVYGYDWDQYQAVRGTYFDIMAEPPGPAVAEFDDLIDVFRNRAWAEAAHDDRLRRFQAQFCEFDDGSATERVIRRVFLGEQVEPPTSLHGAATPLTTWNVDRPA